MVSLSLSLSTHNMHTNTHNSRGPGGGARHYICGEFWLTSLHCQEFLSSFLPSPQLHSLHPLLLLSSTCLLYSNPNFSFFHSLLQTPLSIVLLLLSLLNYFPSHPLVALLYPLIGYPSLFLSLICSLTLVQYLRMAWGVSPMMKVVCVVWCALLLVKVIGWSTLGFSSLTVAGRGGLSGRLDDKLWYNQTSL